MDEWGFKAGVRSQCMRARSLVGSEETGEKRHQRPCLPSEPADRALLFGGMFALRQCDTKERGQDSICFGVPFFQLYFICHFLPYLLRKAQPSCLAGWWFPAVIIPSAGDQLWGTRELYLFMPSKIKQIIHSCDMSVSKRICRERQCPFCLLITSSSASWGSFQIQSMHI